MFVSFEGIDVSGKSTQANLLSEFLKSKGFEICFLREPGGTTISEKIRDILLNRENSDMVDKSEFLLYSASRSQLVSQLIIPALKKKKIVICDRFFDSSTAYQGYGRGIDKEMINIINAFAAGIKPDITFFIDIDLMEFKTRFLAKKHIKDRIESLGEDFFSRVRNGYYEIAKNEASRFIIIDGKQSKNDIAHNIREIVLQRMERNNI